MAKVLITESTLEDIADAIRAKANTNRTYKPSEMAIAIHSFGDEHQPAHINIAQTDNQTITVSANLFSASEVQTEHTTNFTVNVPSSVQLNASVIPETGYAAGALNIVNTVANWGSTVNFNAVAPTKLSPTVTYNVLSAQPVSVGDVNVKYVFTGPSIAATYNLTDNRTISVPTLNNNETYEKVITYYVTEADILEGSIDISITNSTSGITTLITLETEEPTSQLTVARNGASNNSIVVTNTGNLTLYDISIDCTNNGDNITYESIAPGQNQVITLDNLTYTFETVSIEATSPDPDNPDYTLDQTVYFDPTLLDISSYSADNGIQNVTELPYANEAELTNRIIDTTASAAFLDMTKLQSTKSVEASWDTSNVTNMYSMFRNCSSLTSLDVSTWDTANVTNMSEIFDTCINLTTLDVSNWDTSNASDMSFMFNSCRSLTTLDVSNWNTSNVSDMSYMFYRCSSLTALDLSNWNTSNVTNMNEMFSDCSNLTTLDVSNWDTSNVLVMNGIFYTCSSLQYLIIDSSIIKFVFQPYTDIGLYSTCKILVPSNLISLYQANAGWRVYASQFEPIENYNITRSNGQVTVTPNS